MTATAATYN